MYGKNLFGSGQKKSEPDSFHALAELRSAVGERVLVRVPSRARTKARFRSFRGRTAVLKRLLRKNAEIVFDDSPQIWRVPMTWLILPSHALFAQALELERVAGKTPTPQSRTARARRRGRRTSGRARDFQRTRVYRWEDQILPRGRSGLSLSQCERLALDLIRGFGHHGSVPTITDGRGRRSACFDPIRNRIALPHRYRDQRTIVHEVAHFLAFAIAPAEPAHGPLFVRLLIDLASESFGVPVDRLEQSCALAKLAVAARL